MKKKLIIIVIILMLIAGAGIWYLNTGKTIENSTPITETENETEENDEIELPILSVDDNNSAQNVDGVSMESNSSNNEMKNETSVPVSGGENQTVQNEEQGEGNGTSSSVEDTKTEENNAPVTQVVIETELVYD